MRARPLRSTARVLLVRLLTATALWLILTEGDLRYPPVAGLAILAAAATSMLLAPPARARAPHPAWRPLAVLRFLGFFTRLSVEGGLDVARRSLDPRLPVRPGYIEYRARLPEGPGRLVFTATIGLLPGTLATRLMGDRIRIHVLDVALPAEANLRRLEERVGGVFGTPVSSPEPPG
jgi:multicomponent Na+:H+ antiporter subunit E